ncbi:MAG: hypothetical protein FJW31_30775 [Acidobacteria bacterium]|nr:hypothetical protein [Acidobacteriota bacterium]
MAQFRRYLNAIKLQYTSVFYVSGAASQIHVIEVASRRDIVFSPGSEPRLDANGVRFSYLAVRDGLTQLFIGDALTGSSHALSNEPDGIVDHAISGDGTLVVAATGRGRLLIFEVSTGLVSERLGRAPRSPSTLAPLVPGSYNELVDAVLSSGLRLDVRIGGLPVTLLGPTQNGYAFQMPWETPVGSQTMTIALPGDEPIWQPGERPAAIRNRAGQAIPLRARPGERASVAIHEDWMSLVTDASPARPGELIHMFGAGYGPVDGKVQTGEPTPTDRLYRITSGCTWRALGVLTDPSPIEAPFARLAPGMVGVYQLDFRIPSDWPYPLFNA